LLHEPTGAKRQKGKGRIRVKSLMHVT